MPRFLRGSMRAEEEEWKRQMEILPRRKSKSLMTKLLRLKL